MNTNPVLHSNIIGPMLVRGFCAHPRVPPVVMTPADAKSYVRRVSRFRFSAWCQRWKVSRNCEAVTAAPLVVWRCHAPAILRRIRAATGQPAATAPVWWPTREVGTSIFTQRPPRHFVGLLFPNCCQWAGRVEQSVADWRLIFRGARAHDDCATVGSILCTGKQPMALAIWS